MTGTDIAESVNFPLAKKDEIAEAFADLAGEDFDALDLPLIHAGTGKSVEWVPERGAREVGAVLTGVILRAQTARAYYPDAFSGGGELPACHSDDGVTGTGDPGGDCGACPLNVFGSGEGDSKACAEKRLLFVLEPGTIFPVVVQVSAGSLRSWKQYRISMANLGGYRRWTTELRLETASGSHGSFPRIGFRPGERLTDEARATVLKYGEQMAPHLERAAPVYQGEEA